MTLTVEQKQEIVSKHGRGTNDTGSAEVQVALLTARINELTEHLREHTQGSPLAPRPADAGRQAPPPAGLPPAHGSRSVPRADRRSRPAPMIEAGTPAPDFTLPDQDGNLVSLADLRGKTTVLVFYPMDFSPVCTDQLNVYQEVGDDLAGTGVDLYGVSVDSAFAHKAFQKHLGVSIPLLSDFHPKGEVARRLRRIHRGARPQPACAGADRARPRGRVVAPVALAAGDPGRQPDLRRARSAPA